MPCQLALVLESSHGQVQFAGVDVALENELVEAQSGDKSNWSF